MQILYYTGIANSLSVLIPKKNSRGYLKSPFGGHHANSKYIKFTQLNIQYAGDCFDIDGYLSINVPRTWDSGYKKGIIDILDGLLSVFNYAEGYKEISQSEFFKHVLTI